MSLEEAILRQAITTAEATYLLGPELDLSAEESPEPQGTRQAARRQGRRDGGLSAAQDATSTSELKPPPVTARHVAALPGTTFVTACAHHELVRALEARERRVVVVTSDEDLIAEPPSDATCIVPLTSVARDGRFTPADMLRLARRLAENPRLRALLRRLLESPIQVLLGFSPHSWLLAFLHAHLFEGGVPAVALRASFDDGRIGAAAWSIYRPWLLRLRVASAGEERATFWAAAAQELVKMASDDLPGALRAVAERLCRHLVPPGEGPCGDVLLVEDNEDNRIVYTTILRHFGYSVCEATNGEEGLALILARTPRLVLLDISIPIIDGWELLQLCRLSPSVRHLPIVPLTAHALASDREKAMEVGADGYLAKPAEPRVVVREVHRFIGDPAAGPRSGL